MGETRRALRLPEGYRLDLADPDAPTLRRPDGSAASRFAGRGMAYEAVEREALEDLTRTSGRSRNGEPRSLHATWTTIRAGS
jgi:hypothetical protein